MIEHTIIGILAFGFIAVSVAYRISVVEHRGEVIENLNMRNTIREMQCDLSRGRQGVLARREVSLAQYQYRNN